MPEKGATMAKPLAPEGYNTVNPFIITQDALAVIDFLREVFGGEELEAAHTVDDDGQLLHAEVRIGDSIVMLADRKPDWPYTPSLLQVYVDDLDETLARARRLGARVVTEPTGFFGATMSRVLDPWGNLWWIYRQDPDAAWSEAEWSAAAQADSTSEKTGDEWGGGTDPGLTYIHDTLLEAMRNLRSPRDS